MAELADALDSGSSEGSFMQVQVLFPAPKSNGKVVRLFYIHSLADDLATKRENWMNSNEGIDGAKAETEVLNIGKYVNNGVILGF